MAVYEYNLSSINEYLEDSYGILSSSPNEVVDCGKISDCSDVIENHSSITYTETIVPFGTIKVDTKKVKSTYKRISVWARRLDDINNKSIILNGLYITWFGYGTLFELNNGLERLVVPDKSGGGV